MANIITKIAQIRAAILGKDVRENIASGIEVINSEVESTTSKQNNLKSQFDSLVINAGSSNAEIVAGRTSNTTGLTSDTIGHRIDGVDAQLEEKALLTINYDEVGTAQNATEQVYTYPNRINFGELNDAPTVKNIPNKGIDIIGHWYNDFGLESVANALNSANGWYGWYDWQWNHESNVNYDPKRHPVLGYYKGDDPKVLDWQSYWLAESGVNVVSITQSNGFDNTNWSNPSDKQHWVYQLMNNAKNFKSLKYILWGLASFNKTKLEHETQNDKIVATYQDYNNAYAYVKNGKRYATMMVWSLEQIRGCYDAYNGHANTSAYLIALGAKFKAIGYDGVCVMAREFSPSEYTDAGVDYLAANDVILLNAGYETKYGTDSTYTNLYENYANNCVFPTSKSSVVNVVTSAKTQAPHPSTWNIVGSTPALFKTLIQRAVNHIYINKLPKMLTIYNVSEWAEGGAGLQPNVADGFGYLDAVKSLSAPTKDNIDVDKIKSDVKTTILTNSKELSVIKKNAVTLVVGENVVDMGFLALYNYLDSKDNYAFSVDLDFPTVTSAVAGVTYATKIDFPSSRIYVYCYNTSGSSITGVGVSILIKKITP